jgi:hypothetical protein
VHQLLVPTSKCVRAFTAVQDDRPAREFVQSVLVIRFGLAFHALSEKAALRRRVSSTL